MRRRLDPTEKRFDGKRAPREAPPPSRFGRSKSGSPFVLRRLSYRNATGAKLYRLGYLISPELPPLYGNQTWTLAQLEAAGVIWIDYNPWPQPLTEADPNDTGVLPAGAVADEDDEDSDE